MYSKIYLDICYFNEEFMQSCTEDIVEEIPIFGIIIFIPFTVIGALCHSIPVTNVGLTMLAFIWLIIIIDVLQYIFGSDTTDI